jgi:hypothetical protein
MTIELSSFPEDLCVLLGRHLILLGRRLCKESVWILGSPEVHLSKGWTSVTTTEDEAVVWEEQVLSDRPGASFPPEVQIVTLQFLVNTFFFRYRQYQLVNFYS